MTLSPPPNVAGERPTMPLGGWPLRLAIVELMGDTHPEEVAAYKVACSGTNFRQQEVLGRDILWPALCAKVREGLVTARGRREGEFDPENISGELFVDSEPQFDYGAIRQADLVFHGVRLFPADLTTPVSAQRSEVTKRSEKKQPGIKPTKRAAIVDKMVVDIRAGTTTLEQLGSEKQEALASLYGACRETAQKALAQVKSELSQLGIPTNSDS